MNILLKINGVRGGGGRKPDFKGERQRQKTEFCSLEC